MSRTQLQLVVVTFDRRRRVDRPGELRVCLAVQRVETHDGVRVGCGGGGVDLRLHLFQRRVLPLDPPTAATAGAAASAATVSATTAATVAIATTVATATIAAGVDNAAAACGGAELDQNRRLPVRSPAVRFDNALPPLAAAAAPSERHDDARRSRLRTHRRPPRVPQRRADESGCKQSRRRR